MRREIGLGLVVASLGAMLFVGYATKAGCVDGQWTGQQYTSFCYTDIVPLLGTEQLQGDRLPYLDPCAESAANCDEYPVVTMYAMRAAAWVTDSITGFFFANAALLALAALATVLSLRRLAGDRVLYFILAPTFAIYAFMNWDLLAVAAATGATLAASRRKDLAAGALIGLGAAAKLYPALLLVPFMAQRWKEGDRGGAGRVAAGAAASWLALNVPFAVFGWEGWSRFFRFSAERGADWDSLAFLACHSATGEFGCGDTRLLNTTSAIAFALTFGLVWLIKHRRDPGFAPWTLAFPMLVLFLLTGKVYSPQFSLWLLPWFVLVFPNISMFLLFSISEIAVFLTRFSYFAEYSGGDGVPIEAFEIAIAARAAVLIACVVMWTLERTDERPALGAESAIAGAT